EPESEDEEDLGFSSSIAPLPVEPDTDTPLRRIDLRQLNGITKPGSLTRNVNATSSPIPSSDMMTYDEDISPAAFVPHAAPQSNQRGSFEDHEMSTSGGPLKVTLVANLKPSAAPTIADFTDPIVRSLLRKAVRQYEALICGKNSFPSLAIQVQWATKVWEDSQINREKDCGDTEAPRYEFTDRMLRLVSHCSSSRQYTND
ncbi:hypothetical protein H0H92_015767, partial [Tricholoma furcatifolium]